MTPPAQSAKNPPQSFDSLGYGIEPHDKSYEGFYFDS